MFSLPFQDTEISIFPAKHNLRPTNSLSMLTRSPPTLTYWEGTIAATLLRDALVRLVVTYIF